MNKKNLVFLDVETTGLDVDKNEIIELGVVVVRQNGVNTTNPVFEIIEEIDLKIKPEHIETADPVALRVNGYNEADWLFAVTLENAMKLLAEKAKGGIMVAHNVAFDYGFIEHAFKKTGIENTMHYHKLDTISIAFAKLHLNEDVDKFSLHFLAEHFGIENKKAHSALSDARTTFELYKKLMTLTI
jgi:DNA polymerase-3 subunit epsilon